MQNVCFDRLLCGDASLTKVYLDGKRATLQVNRCTFRVEKVNETAIV